MEDKTREGQSTQEHVLAAATQLFTERGFANVSIREICDKAGVSPPTIYHYYGSKDGLFKAVVQQTMNLGDFRETLAGAIGKQPDPESQLRSFIHTYLSAFPKHLLNPGLYIQNSTQLNGLSADRFMREFETVDTLVTTIIKRGIEAGVFREIDPEKTTTCLMNMLVSFILGEVYFDQRHDPDEVAPFIFDLFLEGLRG